METKQRDTLSLVSQLKKSKNTEHSDSIRSSNSKHFANRLIRRQYADLSAKQATEEAGKTKFTFLNQEIVSNKIYKL